MRLAVILNRIVLIVGTLLVAATLVVWAIAISSLSADGPNPTGWGALAVANRLAPTSAVVVAAAVVASPLLGRGSATVRAGGLLLASGASALFAIAVHSIASVLLNALPQAQMPDANALFLGILATGAELGAVPAVLAAAAIALLIADRVRIREAAIMTPIPERVPAVV